MASRSLNKVILLGNLTRNPELKHTPAGTPVCTFGLATNRSWTTSDGTTREEAQYHRVVAWQKLAELCQKLLSKGKKIYLEGRITYRDYTNKEGVQKTVAEIIADDFILLSQSEVKKSQGLNDDEVYQRDTAETSSIPYEDDEENVPFSDSVDVSVKDIKI